MFKVVIVDDEPLARSVIKEYLTAFTDLQVVLECSNGFEGLKAISSHEPDLVFLDIQMPKISGLEMLELIDEPPDIIFTTAFDEFAIKAFESNAIDYLLKPFSQERFNKAVLRWKEQKGRLRERQQPKELLAAISPRQEQTNRIIVRSGHNIRILPLEEIHYVEAYNDYVKIHISGDCFLKKQTMQQTETILGEKNFVRVHRSFIINIGEITRIEALGKETYVAVMRDATKIPLSKPGYAKLKSLLGI